MISPRESMGQKGGLKAAAAALGGAGATAGVQLAHRGGT